MKRSDIIGIVGTITATPELVVDAADWEKKVYETKLERKRPSGTKDTFILQFDGRAAGSEEMFLRIKEGAEVMVGGEIRSENARDPKPEENRVKIFVFAEVIAVNDPPVMDQNEVNICGHICKPPLFRATRRRTKRGKRVEAASVVLAVNSNTGTYYIPCVAFGWQALRVNLLKVGDYVEICGRFQSREYRKRIEGRKLPFLCTVHEVCAQEVKSKDLEERKEGSDNESTVE